MTDRDLALSTIQRLPEDVSLEDDDPEREDFLRLAGESIAASYSDDEVKGFDDIIGTDAEDYSQSGLKVASLVRLGMIATIPDSAVRGRLGSIDDVRLLRLRSRLADQIKAEQ